MHLLDTLAVAGVEAAGFNLLTEFAIILCVAAVTTPVLPCMARGSMGSKAHPNAEQRGRMFVA
jgi:hypothetical protein